MKILDKEGHHSIHVLRPSTCSAFFGRTMLKLQKFYNYIFNSRIFLQHPTSSVIGTGGNRGIEAEVGSTSNSVIWTVPSLKGSTTKIYAICNGSANSIGRVWPNRHIPCHVEAPFQNEPFFVQRSSFSSLSLLCSSPGL